MDPLETKQCQVLMVKQMKRILGFVHCFTIKKDRVQLKYLEKSISLQLEGLTNLPRAYVYLQQMQKRVTPYGISIGVKIIRKISKMLLGVS